MMTRRSTPGLGQWLTVAALVVLVVLLLYKLFQYGNARSALPAGLTIGSVNVGSRTLTEARELLTERYINAPILVFHGDTAIEIDPAQDAEFRLDLDAMASEADYQRSQQDFWAGFWGFIWGRPVEVDPVPLYATHNPDELESVIELIASRLDTPAQPPQAAPTTLSFRFGEPGIRTNVSASLDNITNALYRPTGREAQLILERVEPDRPELNLLARLVVNHLQDFEQNFGGTTSVFILDLTSGDEININSDLPMSGMNIAKIPIILEVYRLLDRPPTAEQARLIEATLNDMGTESANLLLALISGEDDPLKGAERVTQTMNTLGLKNSFIAVPYEARRDRTYPTPANQREQIPTNPDSGMQTTAEDMGALLSMIYFCARNEGGPLVAAFPGQITPDECQAMIDVMATNKIGSLIEEGVPPETSVAHQQGWISDTHGDAGIVFSPGGDYVLVSYLYKPDWLEWELSSPLLADISRATYNFFNFATPYLATTRSN